MEVLPNTFGQLIEDVLNNLNDQLKNHCLWLDDTYTLAQAGQVQHSDGRTYRYPFIYRNDGTTFQHQIAPDQNKRAFIFYESNGPDRFSLTDEANKTGVINYDLNAVVWLNLAKIYPYASNDHTNDLLKEVIKVLLESEYEIMLSDMMIERRIDYVFNRYDYNQAEKQFMLYPFSGFKIRFVAKDQFNLC